MFAAAAAATLALSSSTLFGVASPPAAVGAPALAPQQQQYEQLQRVHHRPNSSIASADQAVGAPLLAAEQQYQQAVQRLHHHRPASHLPSADESAALQTLDPDMFTPEAWAGKCVRRYAVKCACAKVAVLRCSQGLTQLTALLRGGAAGMMRLQQYAQYVDQVMEQEEAPGCESCTANRMMLEKVGGGVEWSGCSGVQRHGSATHRMLLELVSQSLFGSGAA